MPESNISAPQPISDIHDVSNFDCGELSLNEWLSKRALKNHLALNSKTYIVCRNNIVIAYYAIHVGCIFRQELNSNLRRQSPKEIPAIILGRLAVDKNYQKQGIALDLMYDLYNKVLKLSEVVGAKVLLVQALNPEVTHFYKKLSFKAFSTDPLTWYLSIKEIKNSFQ